MKLARDHATIQELIDTCYDCAPGNSELKHKLHDLRATVNWLSKFRATGTKKPHKVTYAVVKKYLESIGYVVDTTCNGSNSMDHRKSALRKARQASFMV
jgi:hypothetical protein